jgi:hypothetical protein
MAGELELLQGEISEVYTYDLETKDGEEWYPTLEQLRIWSNAYKNIDVGEQFVSMRSWLMSNPTRRKTRRGMSRFVDSWLRRENKSQHMTTRDSGRSTRSTTLLEDLTDTSWI